ncbi:hypothetical protein F2Q69_00019340 [Brassica cretica]|uniref:Uncharacterized protein n=1 Tax=Brassica cretica TaxID=69181 RepID=A0A8S9QJB0_BRACR|nr:hypothetical protein F2Q69_00019340 [Brassica cretica]
MAPRTKQKAMKTLKITREIYVRPAGHNAPASYPWPHVGKEGQPIDLDDPMLLTFNCVGWDKESAQKYNMLLNTEILPTRFGHTETLAALGLDTDVFETLNAMGIAPPLLPDTRTLPGPSEASARYSSYTLRQPSGTHI